MSRPSAVFSSPTCPVPVFLFVATLVAVGPERVYAQSTVVSDCARCVMQRERVVELGSEDGDGALGSPAGVVRRLNGEWVVADYQGSGRFYVFAPDGTFRRTVGRKGRGPGEYSIPDDFRVLPGDSLEVVDYFGFRITTLSPSLDVVRTRPTGPLGHQIAFLPDGRHVIAGSVRSAVSIGLPLHLVSAGKIVRSFGADPPIQSVANSMRMWRSLASAKGGAVWSSELLRYVIEQWDSSGTRRMRLERTAPWFQPQREYGVSSDPSRPPRPGLVFIDTDSVGMIWTAIRIPDADYPSAFVEGFDPYGRRTDVVQDLNRYYDTVVEVIDPERKAVVGRANMDENVQGFAGNGFVFTYELRGEGYPVVSVWRLRLPQPPPSGRQWQ